MMLCRFPYQQIQTLCGIIRICDADAPGFVKSCDLAPILLKSGNSFPADFSQWRIILISRYLQ